MSDASNFEAIPATAIAARLAEQVGAHQSLLHIADDERAAEEIASALRSFVPDAEVVSLPPWDCLPYDRVWPTRESMGRRMTALKAMHERPVGRRVVVTSVEAALQPVPPIEAVAKGFIDLVVGQPFDRDEFADFAARTGYIVDDRVDEAGEIAVHGDVVDVFPAGAERPVRILIGPDGTVAEMKSYDPVSQRTVEDLSDVNLGPASEIIGEAAEALGESTARPAIESAVLAHYGTLSTIFDAVPDATITTAGDLDTRLDHALAIIDDARRAVAGAPPTPFYLDKGRWEEATRDRTMFKIPMSGLEAPPKFTRMQRPAKSLAGFVEEQCGLGRRTAILGSQKQLERIKRLLFRHTDRSPEDVQHWSQVTTAPKGAFLSLDCGLAQGFIDTASGLAVLTSAEMLRAVADAPTPAAQNLIGSEPELRIGDVVLHEDHGLGVLRALEIVEVDGSQRDTARLEYHGGASQLVPVEEFGRVWRYGAAPEAVTLDKLNGTGWADRRETVLAEVKRIARHLVDSAKARAEGEAAIIKPPRAAYAKFEARFPYAETEDQAAAIRAVLADLGSGVAMNRLICGDVGFGKTEIALRAAAAVALSGKQVAIVAPTTVLARQHFETFRRRFEGLGIKVGHLSRLTQPAAAKALKQDLKSGDVGIVVATQAVSSKTVSFKHLGLLVIDEEHRFGTKAKQAMREMAPHLHTLTMSATPIPRTLLSAMSGVQDVSVLSSAPAKRRPIRTFLSPFDAVAAKVALMRERRRGGQSFFVVPRIKDIDGVASELARIAPDLEVKVAHGDMKDADLDDVMVTFAQGAGDVLLATSIIESGLDVPRANTMMVWRSDRFGLAQLHQLRGRVGRGRAQGVAYLYTDPKTELAEETRSRLSTLVAMDRLGAGLAISGRDLDLRGGGDLVGEEQAGHMRVLGVGLYQRLLARAVLLARGEPDIYRRPATVRMGPTGSFPSTYIADAGIRLNLYSRLLQMTTPADVDALADEIADRFGTPPPETDLLIEVVRLGLSAAALGIAQIDAGDTAIGIRFAKKPARGFWKEISRFDGWRRKEDRLIVDRTTIPGTERAAALAEIVASIGKALQLS